MCRAVRLRRTGPPVLRGPRCKDTTRGPRFRTLSIVRVTRVPSELAAKPYANDDRTWAVDCPACHERAEEFGLMRLRIDWTEALRVADWHNKVVHGVAFLGTDEPPLA